MIEAAPVVEPVDRQTFGRVAAAGLAFAAAAAYALRFGADAAAVAAAAFLGVLAVVSAVDVERRRIPNVVVLPASLVALSVVGFLDSSRLLEALAAGSAAYAFFFVPALISPRLVGMGDAKLAFLIGVMLGRDVVSALLVAALVAGSVAVVLLVSRGRAARNIPLPFGPFLATGAAVALIAGGGTLYP